MVVTTPSPKSKFIAIKHCVEAHAELLQRQDLQVGLDYAEKQFLWELMKEDGIDGNRAASRYYMVKGANEFLRVFRTLTQMPEAPKQAKGDEMDHKF